MISKHAQSVTANGTRHEPATLPPPLQKTHGRSNRIWVGCAKVRSHQLSSVCLIPRQECYDKSIKQLQVMRPPQPGVNVNLATIASFGKSTPGSWTHRYATERLTLSISPKARAHRLPRISHHPGHNKLDNPPGTHDVEKELFMRLPGNSAATSSFSAQRDQRTTYSPRNRGVCFSREWSCIVQYSTVLCCPYGDRLDRPLTALTAAI